MDCKESLGFGNEEGTRIILRINADNDATAQFHSRIKDNSLHSNPVPFYLPDGLFWIA